MRKKWIKQHEENEQELDLLSAYYPVDRQKKLVTASIRADSIVELLEEPDAPGLRGRLKEDFFESCKKVISQFPEPYRLNAEITVTDWGGHTPREFARTVRDAIEMTQNTNRLQGRRVQFLSAIFVIAGFLVLALMLCGEQLGWFGEGLSSDLWERGIDTLGTVLIWEAAVLVFLNSSEQSAVDPEVQKRIGMLTFLGPEGKVLLRVSNEQLLRHTNWAAQLKRIVRDCMLVSSSGFVIAGINGMMFLFQDGERISGALRIAVGVIMGTISLLQILAGVGGFYLFWGKKNRLTTFTKVFASCILIIVLMMMVFTAATSSFSGMLWMALSCFLELLFIFSLFLDEKISRMDPPQMEEVKD